MAGRVLILGAVLLVAQPAVAAAQQQGSQPRSCRQVLPSDARRLLNARGQEIIYFLDPVRVLCTGGLLLEADSAVMNRAESTVQLVGNVVYRDSLQQLTADWANYIGQRDQLLARGAVVLQNLEDGSTVQGEELDYLRETDQRPQSRMVVRGGRPYARIPPRAPADTISGAETGPVVQDTGAAGTDTAAVTEIWADRMEFEGEDVFRGIGNVELARGDMTGAGASATFDQRAEQMTLTGDAFVETDRYRLEGERIDAHLRQEELESVFAERNARVVSEDLTVESDRIRIGFTDGRLERMEAWNPEPDSVARVLADASDFRLRADSVDARADSLGLQEVRAVGRAYGERSPDSLSAPLAATIDRDWIQGDTILGFFERRPVVDSGPPPIELAYEVRQDTAGVDTVPVARRVASEGDSTEVVLERIVVIGGGQPALSLYHMAADTRGGEPSINFMKAERITLYMDQGDVSRVEADGPLDGLYLSPSPPPTEPGAEAADGAESSADAQAGEEGTGGGP